MARLEDILVRSILGAREQAARQALSLGALGQIGGFQPPESAANVPLDSETFVSAIPGATRAGTDLATRPGEVARGLADVAATRALEFQRRASGERTASLTPLEADTERARAESTRALAGQRNQSIRQRAQIFQIELDQEEQRLANLEEQAKTERAQQGFISARTQAELAESREEVRRLRATTENMLALARLRGEQAETEEAIRPSEVALREAEVETERAETEVERERAEAIRRESLQTVESMQIDDATKVRIADATVDRIDQQARKYGLEADRLEAITPIMTQFESAKLAEQLTMARRAEDEADFEAQMNELRLETERKVQEQYDARIEEIRSRVDLNEAEEDREIQAIELDREKALAWVRTETNRAGVQAALADYHEARTGEVQAEIDAIRQKLPLELQVLENEADWRAQRTALLEAQIASEQFDTEAAKEQAEQEAAEHRARLREIETRIQTQAAALREQEARADIAESQARVAESTEQATIDQAIAEAKEAVADYDFKKRTLEARIQEQNLAPTIDAINALLDTNELGNIDPIDLVLLDSLADRGLVPEDLAERLGQTPSERIPALRPLIEQLRSALDMDAVVRSESGETGQAEETPSEPLGLDRAVQDAIETFGGARQAIERWNNATDQQKLQLRNVYGVTVSELIAALTRRRGQE